MPNLTSLIRYLEKERNRLHSQLNHINVALSSLNGTATRKGSMSAAGRARVAAAQRARWAKVKGRKVVSIASRSRRRKLSAAAIARIRAAQKARWAKWRKAHRG